MTAVSRAVVLETAASLITGDRAAQYGDARSTHKAIDEIVAILCDLQGEEISEGRSKGWPPGVGAMLFHLSTKLVRAARTPGKADTWVDIAGYAALAAELAEAE